MQLWEGREQVKEKKKYVSENLKCVQSRNKNTSFEVVGLPWEIVDMYSGSGDQYENSGLEVPLKFMRGRGALATQKNLILKN